MSSRLAIAAVGAATTVVALALALRRTRKRKVVITGGCGNLGGKLACHLLKSCEWDVVLLEHPDFYSVERVPAGASVMLGDLADGLGAWTDALRGADSVVHFSAVNPYPNATFGESALSMSHAFNVFLEAQRRGVRRVVFASSNHVMGQYKEMLSHGKVRPTDPPACGTPLRNKKDLEASGDAIAYSVAKMSGEQLAKAIAATSARSLTGPRTTFYVLRIGWCQPGENSPKTLSAAGVPPEFQTQGVAGGSAAGQAEDIDGDWFKGMWLSNGDFLRYFEAAIRGPPPEAGSIVLVNAMSNNRGMRWSLDETVAALGVVARDDSRA